MISDCARIGVYSATFVQYVFFNAFLADKNPPKLHGRFSDARRIVFFTEEQSYVTSNRVLLLGGSFCSILKYKPIQFSCPVSMYTIFLQYSQTQRADSLMAVRETFGHFVYTK